MNLFAGCQAYRGLPAGFRLLRYSVLFTVELFWGGKVGALRNMHAVTFIDIKCIRLETMGIMTYFFS